MYRLEGALNVARLEELYEDDEHVHIVMEFCSGGDLCHRIGKDHYSERTVGFMSHHSTGSQVPPCC